MPDFMLETHWQCSSMSTQSANIGGYLQIGLFSERHYPQCSCPAYKFAKRTVGFGGRMYPPLCKHILEAQKVTCTWHSLYSDVPMEKPGVCPVCGKETVAVQVAV